MERSGLTWDVRGWDCTPQILALHKPSSWFQTAAALLPTNEELSITPFSPTPFLQMVRTIQSRIHKSSTESPGFSNIKDDISLLLSFWYALGPASVGLGHIVRHCLSHHRDERARVTLVRVREPLFEVTGPGFKAWLYHL